MVRDLRGAKPVLAVLRALLAEPTSLHYGYELCTASGISSGSLYPILVRLEHAGWLNSGWEPADGVDPPGPRRRYYVLTDSGVERAVHLLNDRAPRRSRRPRLARAWMLAANRAMVDWWVS